MKGTCTGGVIQAKLSLFGLGILLLGCLVVGTSWAQDEVSFIRQDFRAGDNPSSVTVGDFNGDGQQDLATGDRSSTGSVFILLGQGDGTFEPPHGFVAGEDPHFVIVGDFNGDGRQDLAAADRIDSVAILLGRGDGVPSASQLSREYS